jgi:DNA-binding transcriptional ArsR family regulator
VKVTTHHAAHLPPEQALMSAVEVFKALGNRPRLSIVHALSHGELSVTELARSLGLSPTVTSQHLAILRRLKLVQGRDDGRLTYYRVIAEAVGHLVHDCLEHCGAPERKRAKGVRR